LNFDKLPADVRNLIDKLQGVLQEVIEANAEVNKIGAINLISTIRSKIDKDFALKILDRLSKDKNEKEGGNINECHAERRERMINKIRPRCEIIM